MPSNSIYEYIWIKYNKVEREYLYGTTRISNKPITVLWCLIGWHSRKKTTQFGHHKFISETEYEYIRILWGSR